MQEIPRQVEIIAKNAYVSAIRVGTFRFHPDPLNLKLVPMPTRSGPAAAGDNNDDSG